MNLLKGAYAAIEARFFRTLSRKLAGNVFFLVLLQGVSLIVLYQGNDALLALLARSPVDPAVLAAAEALLTRHFWVIAGIYLASIAAAAFAFCFLRFLIVRPMRISIQRLRALSRGGGDLSADIPVLTRDEIGDLAEAYNAFAGKLRQIIGEVRHMGLNIAGESAQVTVRVQDCARKAREQEELAGAIASSSEDVGEAIEVCSRGLQEVSASTAGNVETARASHRELRDVTGDVEGVAGKLAAFRTAVEELNRTSHETEAIVSLIQDISDQTNLLALNAAIEAARAGEAGRGFAVVAEEVRKLADKVKAAAGDISRNIRGMTAQAQEVLDETVRIGADTDRVRTVVEKTSAEFEGMVLDLEATNGRLEHMASAVEEFSATNRHVHEKIGAIRALSVEAADGMTRSGVSSSELSQITEKLQGLVSLFRLGEGCLEEAVVAVERWRDRFEERITTLQAGGVDVFDEQYRPVPETSPPKYENALVEPFTRELQPLFDRALEEIPGAGFALCVDRNGFAPTHNGKYARPPTGDPAVDLVASRHQRKFDDRTGLRAARNEAPLLLQTYCRDTGEIMSDLSMPLRVAGRHWGAVRVGLDPAALLEG